MNNIKEENNCGPAMLEKSGIREASASKCVDLAICSVSLLLLSLIGLGTWVCWDSAGALQKVFMQQLDVSDYQYSLVFSVSSWPNPILCLVGGYLVDRLFGIRFGTVFYCVVATLGQLIFTLGVLYISMWAILLGRFIFGIGMESVFICLQFYAVHLFPANQVPLITCILFSLIRLGSSLIYYIAPPLYHMFLQHYSPVSSLSAVFAITVCVLVVSSVCSVILGMISTRTHPEVKRNPQVSSDDVQAKIPLQQNKTLRKSSLISSITRHLSFPVRFWILCFINVSYTTALYVLLPFSQNLFIRDYGMSLEEANMVTTWHTVVSAVLSPLVGLVVDRLILRIDIISLLGVGLASSSVVYLLLAFIQLSPYIPMMLLSLSYALWSSLLTPVISRTVTADRLGTAFGMVQSTFNLMYSMNMMLAGVILEHSSGYFQLYLFILAWIADGLLAVLYLRFGKISKRRCTQY